MFQKSISPQTYIMDVTVCERVRGNLKSNSVLSLQADYQCLKRKLRSKCLMSKEGLLEKINCGILRRNVAAENFVPDFFKNVNENIVVLRYYDCVIYITIVM